MLNRKSVQIIARSILALALLSAAVPMIPAQRNTIRVAVLDFEMPQNGGELRSIMPNLNQMITNRIEAGLVALRSYEMVERSRIDKLLNERNLIQNGVIDPQTAAEVGRILGVDAIIYGGVDAYEVNGMRSDGNFQAGDLSVTVKTHFKLTNTTTGKLLISEIAVSTAGNSGDKRKTENIREQADTAAKAADALSRIFRNRGIRNPVEPTRAKRPDSREVQEHCRALTDQAVGDVVGQIVGKVQETKSQEIKNRRDIVNKIDGEVIRVSGDRVFISGIHPDIVQAGDKLTVRRNVVERDSKGKSITFTERVGEVEVMEVQESIVVARFSAGAASLQPARGDKVSNQ
jgi:curli biogenesis system outer membrane secretion channel CsgG